MFLYLRACFNFYNNIFLENRSAIDYQEHEKVYNPYYAYACVCVISVENIPFIVHCMYFDINVKCMIKKVKCPD